MHMVSTYVLDGMSDNIIRPDLKAQVWKVWTEFPWLWVGMCGGLFVSAVMSYRITCMGVNLLSIFDTLSF
jgi:hypothetical protein